MQISEYGRAPVPPPSAWIAIVTVTLLLGGMGLYEIQTGHLPTAPPWMTIPYHGLAGGILLFLWVSFLVGFLPTPRNVDPSRSRRIYSPTKFISILGPTLFLGGILLSSLGRASVWMQNAGLLVMFLHTMSDFITFGKRRSPIMPPDTPSQTVPWHKK